jgi:hypothetical protein
LDLTTVEKDRGAIANVRAGDNLKTAKALNLTIAQSVLYRADRVIK